MTKRQSRGGSGGVRPDDQFCVNDTNSTQRPTPLWKGIGIATAAVVAFCVIGSLASLGGGSSTETASAAPATTIPAAPAAPKTYTMPDFRGQTVGEAANIIHAALGPNTLVESPGDNSSVSQPVVATDPAPGAPVTASTVFHLYPAVTSTTTPAPTTTETPPTTDPAPASDDSSGGVYVDHGHTNHRDGALTGGYCRHKWWC